MIHQLQTAVMMIRMQLLEAQTRREEVCQIIKNTTDPKDPRHDCREPDMVLTQEEVDFFMRQHRLSFEAEVSQVRVQKSLHICKILNCTTLREYANDGNCYSHICMSFHRFVCIYIHSYCDYGCMGTGNIGFSHS